MKALICIFALAACRPSGPAPDPENNTSRSAISLPRCEQGVDAAVDKFLDHPVSDKVLATTTYSNGSLMIWGLDEDEIGIALESNKFSFIDFPISYNCDGLQYYLEGLFKDKNRETFNSITAPTLIPKSSP